METTVGSDLDFGLALPVEDTDMANTDTLTECASLLQRSSQFMEKTAGTSVKNAIPQSTREVTPEIPEVSGTFDLFDIVESPRRSPRILKKMQSMPEKKEPASPSTKAQKAGKATSTPKPKPKPVPKLKLKPKPKPRARKTELDRMGQQLDLLTNKNTSLRQKIWSLENEITVLKAKIMTDADELALANETELQLDHARRYIRALKAQVRAQGGYAMQSKFESDSDDDGSDSDGELPASFPRGAANPSEFSLLAMRQRKRRHSKK